MRYCDNLEKYEKAKAEGSVTDDVLVIVLEEKVAKFKGKTFEWNDGIKAINEIAGLFALADGFVSENDEHYYLPHKAPADDLAHTFAMLSDLEGAGGSIMVDEMLSETSINPVQNRVITAALNSKADRIGSDMNNDFNKDF